ncbi:MAG: uncharacterized protein QOJ63_1546 [Solirubrobacteraceae bacterium]|jgi:uncharacterized protein YggE|nr:uncharacterized protein [Solirubrobacteraceae bacterium]
MAHSGRIRRTSTAVALAGAVVATAALATTPAGAQAPVAPATPPNTITVTGSAQVTPKPRDKKSEASIKKAVVDARRAAIPLAIGNGQGRAATLSKLAGLPLGKLISISEATPSPFYYPGPYGEDGTLGAGKYCGTVRTPIFRRDAQGRRKVVGTRTRHTCRVPRVVSSNLIMVFSTG